jgi:type IV pilus assembly protein PilE
MKGREGVTLIEVMVVVAIVGMLAAIAIPAYNDYITRSRRSDAFTALETVRAAQEMFRAERGLYQPVLGSLPGCSANMAGDNYTIDFSAVTATTFTVRATPKNQQAGDFTFTVDQNGDKTYNGTALTSKSWEDLPRHP